MTDALLAEYATPSALLEAITAARTRGYRKLEAYTPYPVPEVDEALAAPPSRLPWIVLAAGLSAAAGAYGLQFLLNAYLYPLNVGARPPHFPLAYVPITFEMGILFASLAAFFGVLALGRLLRLYDPVFEVPGFESATKDGFWLCIDASDPGFDASTAERDLHATRPVRVVRWSRP
jgi:hypothetical protein